MPVRELGALRQRYVRFGVKGGRHSLVERVSIADHSVWNEIPTICGFAS